MLRYQATLVDPDAPAWAWEVTVDSHRVHWEITRGDITAVHRDITRWFGLAFCRQLAGECQCGGTLAGYPVFGAGHSHWCPVAPAALDILEAP